MINLPQQLQSLVFFRHYIVEGPENSAYEGNFVSLFLVIIASDSEAIIEFLDQYKIQTLHICTSPLFAILDPSEFDNTKESARTPRTILNPCFTYPLKKKHKINIWVFSFN